VWSFAANDGRVAALSTVAGVSRGSIRRKRMIMPEDWARVPRISEGAGSQLRIVDAAADTTTRTRNGLTEASIVDSTSINEGVSPLSTNVSGTLRR